MGSTVTDIPETCGRPKRQLATGKLVECGNVLLWGVTCPEEHLHQALAAEREALGRATSEVPQDPRPVVEGRRDDLRACCRADVDCGCSR